jgi:hypothetical protein
MARQAIRGAMGAVPYFGMCRGSIVATAGTRTRPRRVYRGTEDCRSASTDERNHKALMGARASPRSLLPHNHPHRPAFDRIVIK